MELGLSQMLYEWSDEHRRLALANERRRCSNDRLGARYSHRPEKNYGELANEPLEDSIIKAELDKGHEKYNCLEFLQGQQ